MCHFQDINIARDSINARNYSTQINLLRTIYQVDRLEMDNQSERSRLLFYSIIGCILILGISIVSVLYIRKINARLIASQHKLEKPGKVLRTPFVPKVFFCRI